MRIVKGTAPIPIPREATVPGHLRRFSREVIGSIKALRDRKYTVMGSSGSSAAYIPPFQPYGLRLDDDEYKVKVKPGHVAYRKPKAGVKVIEYVMPKINGVDLDDDEPPELVVEAGQTVYLKVSTDSKDYKSADPIIIADDPGKDGTHSQPPNAGVAGEYYYALADIVAGEDENSPPAIRNIRHKGSPLIHSPILPEIENIEDDDDGDDYQVFKERSSGDDKYLMRAIKQLPGSGIPLIKPHPSDPADPEDYVPVRRIRERQTSPQVRVGAGGAATDDFVEVRGNNIDLTIGGLVRNMTVRDGLVTAAEDAAADGWWGTIEWQFVAADSEVRVLTAKFEGGLLVEVMQTIGTTTETKIGTEALPGSVTHTTEDTDT